MKSDHDPLQLFIHHENPCFSVNLYFSHVQFCSKWPLLWLSKIYMRIFRCKLWCFRLNIDITRLRTPVFLHIIHMIMTIYQTVMHWFIFRISTISWQSLVFATIFIFESSSRSPNALCSPSIPWLIDFRHTNKNANF